MKGAPLALIAVTLTGLAVLGSFRLASVGSSGAPAADRAARTDRTATARPEEQRVPSRLRLDPVATLVIPSVQLDGEPFFDGLQVQVSRAERFGSGSSYAYTSVFAKPDEQGALRFELPAMDPFTPRALAALAREEGQGLWVTLAHDLTGARREYDRGTLYVGSNDFLVAEALVVPRSQSLEEGSAPCLVFGDAMHLRPLERLFTVRATNATEGSGHLHWSRNTPEEHYDHDHWEWPSAQFPVGVDVDVFGSDRATTWLLVATGEDGALSKPGLASFETELDLALIPTGTLTIETASGSEDEQYGFILSAAGGYRPEGMSTKSPTLLHRAFVGEDHGILRVYGRGSLSRRFFVGDYVLEQWKRSDLRAGDRVPYRVHDLRISENETTRVSAP